MNTKIKFHVLILLFLSLELNNTSYGAVRKELNASPEALIFDFPVTYNEEVSKWIRYFQSSGRITYRSWLERSSKFLPLILNELDSAKLPKDLAYMVMIESGFVAHATSHAEAVGPWQFIETTGNRYGLKKTWWLDERRDLRKSTIAAVRYIQGLYQEFGSWYLVAASYNMGEGGLRRIINRYKTKDYWKLIEMRALPVETSEYVPKLIAAMLIAKAPGLYGFRNLEIHDPQKYQFITIPGGINLDDIADYVSVTRKSLRDLNAELLFGSIPREVSAHQIRIPMGSFSLVKKFLVAKNERDGKRSAKSLAME
jgi:membrane-bound lytic murein transglycosylase D